MHWKDPGPALTIEEQAYVQALFANTGAGTYLWSESLLSGGVTGGEEMEEEMGDAQTGGGGGPSTLSSALPFQWAPGEWSGASWNPYAPDTSGDDDDSLTAQWFLDAFAGDEGVGSGDAGSSQAPTPALSLGDNTRLTNTQIAQVMALEDKRHIVEGKDIGTAFGGSVDMTTKVEELYDSAIAELGLDPNVGVESLCTE